MDKIREKALLIINEIDKENAYMNIVLNKHLAGVIDKRDRAFISEIVRGTTKMQIRIDHTIKSYSKIKIKKISPIILNILRMGIYQILFMDKVPTSAAVNESVKLAARFGHSASKNFTNAILRVVASKGEAELPKDEEEYLSVFYGYPAWLTKRFVTLFGIDRTKAIMEEFSAKKPIIIRANTLKISSDELFTKLGDLAKEKNGDMITLNGVDAVTEIDGFNEGLFTVQATPFNKMAELLDVKKGMKVLDACAAPGGKTCHIGALMENEGEITATDIYEHKLKLIDDTAKRLGINIIKTRLFDASKEDEKRQNYYDRILLDVPCSGLGIIGRRADIKLNRDENEDFSILQKKILEAKAKELKKGGILIYSTCSIDKRENEDVVLEFLEKHSEFSLLPFDETIGYKTWYPDTDKTDGAFMARLIKK